MPYSKIIASSKGGGSDFEPVPAGVHYAICVGVISLGWQKSTFEGKEKILPKVRLNFEVPDVTKTYTNRKGEEVTAPMAIGRTFTLNIGDKSSLGPILESWRGKKFTDDEKAAFDVTSLAGKVCQLSVVHVTSKGNGKTYANIQTAMGVSKDTKSAIDSGARSTTPHAPIVVYNPDEHDEDMWDLIPEWLRKEIDNRVQDDDVAETATQAHPKDDFDDDIPF